MKHLPQGTTSPQKRSLLRRIRTAESFALVLALIIITFVFVDIAPSNTLTRLVSNILFGAMFFVALRVAGVRVRILLAMLLLTAIALVLSLALSGEDRLLVIPKFIGAVLLALVALVIVFRILRHPSVDVEMIYGALSVYLLIGMFFAFAYAIVGAFTPFFTAPGNYTLQDYLYFSFVTLPTLGFGDLAPKGSLPRTFVVIEAILGQLYLVTIVALLVSNYTRRPPLPPSE
jgi:hypothetical protein